MTKHCKNSKRLHWATLCCFLFPFFYYTGCGGPTKAELEAKAKATQDSIAAAEAANKTAKVQSSTASIAPTKTIKIDSISEKNSTLNLEDSTVENNISKIDTLDKNPLTSKSEKDTVFDSKELVEKYNYLRPILIPKPYTYTGLASIIDSNLVYDYVAIFISFFLLVLCLIIKFIDTLAKKTILLIDIFALFFLFVFPLHSDGFQTLWGYWVTLTFILILTIYDFYILKLNKRLTL